MGALYDDWLENCPNIDEWQYLHPHLYCTGCGFFHNGKYKYCPECGKELK